MDLFYSWWYVVSSLHIVWKSDHEILRCTGEPWNRPRERIYPHNVRFGHCVDVHSVRIFLRYLRDCVDVPN